MLIGFEKDPLNYYVQLVLWLTAVAYP